MTEPRTRSDRAERLETARACLQGLLASPEGNTRAWAELARDALAYADALLAAIK